MSSQPVNPAPVTLSPPSPESDAIVESTLAPTWVGRRRPAWGYDGTKTIAFQLDASHDVPIWTARARPQLVIRCLSRQTEVYVATGSAASYERADGRHTVYLQIDDDPEIREQWSDSASSQELFAPNGPALTRRLARAHRMRFGFTPFNAKPVTADFIVEGFALANLSEEPGVAGVERPIKGLFESLALRNL